jgi:flagellar biosynthetic protein FliP
MSGLTALRGITLRRFLRHYVEMVVAMLGGMIVLGGLESALLGPFGWGEVRAVPELGALIMATNMSVPMMGWMWHRGHSLVAVGQMAAAMYGPFVVCFPLVWSGVLSATGLMIVGHAVMVAAMPVAMLCRLDEYTGHVHERAYA